MSLFIALGIYLGSMYTAKLGTLKGSNANLAVLLFFIIFSTWAIFEIYLPLNSKGVDQITVSMVRNEEDRDFQLREFVMVGIVLGRPRPLLARPQKQDILYERRWRRQFVFKRIV
jgi:hypothetical protein